MSKKLIVVLACILLSVTLSTIASAQDDPWETFYGDEAAAAGILGLSMLCCVLIAIPWIIWLILGIWVYKDAEKRGKSGILWFLIVFILGIIGIIIWLVVRPPIGGEKPAATAEPGRRCPNCGRGIPNDARTCPYCGKNFEETP